MMVFLFFKIGQFLWKISPVFTVDLNIAKIVDAQRQYVVIGTLALQFV